MEATIKSYSRLGFNKEESVKIVDALNNLLANYQIHYQKLRNYHWSVVGKDFFELHEQFELEYNQVKLHIDEIAERIRVFGMMPYRTLQEYLDNAMIKETYEDLDSREMVREVITDFEYLLESMIVATEVANEIGDTATQDMVTNFAKYTEKRHWMLSAWCR